MYLFQSYWVITAALLILALGGCGQGSKDAYSAIEESQHIVSSEDAEFYLLSAAKKFIHDGKFQDAMTVARFIVDEVNPNSYTAETMFQEANAKLAVVGMMEDSGSRGGLSGQPKTYLRILSIFASLAFLYLIARSIGIVDFESMPESIFSIIDRLCVGLMLTTVFLYVYLFNSYNKVWIYLIYGMWGSLLTFSVYGKVRHEFTRRYAKNTDKYWVCRNCGERNANIHLACQHCDSGRSPKGST